MKNKLLTLFLSSIMTFSMMTVATAAVTPGATCSKVGVKQVYKGKTYTCVKSGKKLVWNKGVKVETYDAAFAAAFLAEAKDKAAQILADAKYRASQISSPPKCIVDNSQAFVSLGAGGIDNLISVIFENPGICDITVRASAAFLCPDGRVQKISNYVKSTGIFPLRPGEKLAVNAFNISDYFPQVFNECRSLTGYSTTSVNPSDFHQSPNVMTLTSTYSGDFNQTEATKKANQYFKSEKARADKVIADAKNPTSIAKAWKAEQEAKTAWDAQALEDAKAAEAKASSAECAKSGRNCKIGNTGPGGGIVFYDAGSQQSWGRYLEVAPKGWSVSVSASGVTTGRVAEWCNVGDIVNGWLWDGEATAILGSEEIGKGKANTDLMVAFCSSGACVEARAYKGGGKSDWFLPSLKELMELSEFVRRFESVEFEVGHHWSSSEQFNYAWSVVIPVSGVSLNPKNPLAYVRPIRAF